MRQEKRYLGTVQIPFTTVYMEGKVEGTFKLDVPCLHLGYQRCALKSIHGIVRCACELSPSCWLFVRRAVASTRSPASQPSCRCKLQHGLGGGRGFQAVSHRWVALG